MVNLLPGGIRQTNALNPLDYFTFSYDITLNTTEVPTYRFFYATVTGQATCLKDLPLTPSEAYVTGRVVARHIESGNEITLNNGYTVTLDSFPTKQGETFQATETVPLFFPSDSPLGVYQLTGELVEARFKAVLWFTVTQYLPQNKVIGQVVVLPPTPPGGGAPIEPLPASFTVSDLTINPSEVKEGDVISISVTVLNIGELEGEYEVFLKLNDEILESQWVSLSGGSSSEVTFDIIGSNPDVYLVDINGLAGSFVIAAVELLSPSSTSDEVEEKSDRLSLLIYALDILLLILILMLARYWLKRNRGIKS
jgi:hypothetical protein